MPDAAIVSTARTRAGSIKPLFLMRAASSSVTRSLVMTARFTPLARSRGINCSIRRVLPEPTGPPMPTRAAPGRKSLGDLAGIT